jgi:Holliday junction resolvase RusA-like endonuclease
MGAGVPVTAIEFFVPYEVKPKGNSKTIVRSKSGRVFLIEPKKNKVNADTLRLMFCQHSPAKPFDGPVRVCYQIQYAWRKGDSAKLRALKMVPKVTRPDLGQLEKQIDDVMQAAGFVVDDAQIVSRGDSNGLVHGKFLADRPGIHVRIAEFSS